jgi:hypothetical protein
LSTTFFMVDQYWVFCYNIHINSNKESEMTVAIVSNLPIAELEIVRPVFKTFAKLQGKKMRVRFRGPRYDTMRLTCLKKDAVRFSIYFD